MPPGSVDRRRVVAVVVTYRPDVAATARLLSALAPQVDRVVVVDNGSGDDVVARLRAAGERHDVVMVALEDNSGIARAQNLGVARARQDGADLLLLSDQDSEPAPDMVERLVAGWDRAVAEGRPVAAVGPVIVDERNPDAPLLFVARRWGPRRARLPADGGLVPAVFLLASGTLTTPEAFDAVGPLREDLFIDHVDLEWGLRAGRRGMAVYGVAGARLAHSLGDSTRRILGRERDVHLHSPVRNYFMARNTLVLVRSGLLPRAWQVGYVSWIVKYAVFYVLMTTPRARRLRELVTGLRDGLLGRTGPHPAARRR